MALLFVKLGNLRVRVAELVDVKPVDQIVDGGLNSVKPAQPGIKAVVIRVIGRFCRDVGNRLRHGFLP